MSAVGELRLLVVYDVIFVMLPKRCLCCSCYISAHYEFDRKDFCLADYGMCV